MALLGSVPKSETELRYKLVESIETWRVCDRTGPGPFFMLTVDKTFPNAENLAQTMCDLLNLKDTK